MKKRKVMTNLFYHDLENERILLGMKKRGFGVGRWNGFGGKIKEGETITKSARRELFEEAGIIASELEEFGIIDFEFENKPDEILEVHFFRISRFFGNPRETEEMKPKWFKINEIPYDSMWPDDKIWMPIFLRNKKFKGKILFDNQDKIKRHEIRELDKNHNL